VADNDAGGRSLVRQIGTSHDNSTRRRRGIAERLPFGTAALITYLILEDQRRVGVLEVLWVS